uniref:Uncharacterized protein n=1 Tax=Ascaris lumbricoides TaxID=6252 RepID=A0A9J2Q4Z4_ASCLU
MHTSIHSLSCQRHFHQGDNEELIQKRGLRNVLHHVNEAIALNSIHSATVTQLERRVRRASCITDKTTTTAHKVHRRNELADDSAIPSKQRTATTRRIAYKSRRKTTSGNEKRYLENRAPRKQIKHRWQLPFQFCMIVLEEQRKTKLHHLHICAS